MENDADRTGDTDRPETSSPDSYAESPILANLMFRLGDYYPHFRVTEQISDAGYRYTMIQWADETGEFESGAPGEFVKMVSELACNENTEGDRDV